ncbi:Hypothetical predicted protein [Octopus vulgaris]|uniref:Uncharacterized protein n=1 Tax=Octopus vulgaris TaxID=6645 RepID=A0AA36BCL8_OCTVU|nr:Hypothetical predicted protein [Octopus vulgaris]
MTGCGGDMIGCSGDTIEHGGDMIGRSGDMIGPSDDMTGSTFPKNVSPRAIAICSLKTISFEIGLQRTCLKQCFLYVIGDVIVLQAWNILQRAVTCPTYILLSMTFIITIVVANILVLSTE